MSLNNSLLSSVGQLGGVMVLGKLSVLGFLLIYLDTRARAYCPCSRCGSGVV